jgi:hypothetical protein
MNLSPRIRAVARQREFSLSWRERRDVPIERQVDKTMRFYS